MRHAGRLLAALLLVGLAPRVDAATDPCVAAAARTGRPVCVTRVPDRHTWAPLWVGSRTHWARFLVPARPDARLPTLLSDAHTFPLHVDLLREGFAPLFPGMDPAMYARLVLNPARREFYAGSVVEHPDTGAFTFTIEEVGSGPIDAADVAAVRAALVPAFPLAPLTFEASPAQAARGLGLASPVAGRYDVTVAGEGWGRLRRVRADSLPGDLGPDDVLVLDAAPMDLDTPVAAVVTVAPHGELSHLAVRSAARGTPLCTDPGAWERLAALDGSLVHLSCGADALEVAAASPEAVLAGQAARRPPPVPVLPPDLAWASLTGLRDVPTATAADRATALGRFGAKGANYAALVQRVDAPWVYEGFLIPFQFGHTWMATASVGGMPAGATIAAWFKDPLFLAQRSVRTERMKSLRDVLSATPVADDVVAAIDAQIQTTFGAETMVRFRSSSNAEDALDFSGAGLYTSTSVCAADDLDADDAGPSRCDATVKNERGVARGLRTVWASLWADRAVEERLWYGIDATSVGMAILVDPRASGERANIVAFTGDPGGKPGETGLYVVEAQAGEAEVVSNDPGTWPERDHIHLVEGVGVGIERVTRSSLAAQVLTDDQLREIAARLTTIAARFPVDRVAPPGHDVLLDSEWKVLGDGRLVIKQVRPYLR